MMVLREGTSQAQDLDAGNRGRQAHGVWGTREPGGCPSPGAAEQPDPPTIRLHL